jgi:hypothetical protein
MTLLIAVQGLQKVVRHPNRQMRHVSPQSEIDARATDWRGVVGGFGW